MGNKVSSAYELPDVVRVPLDKPVVAIDQRFCHDEVLTLQHTESGLSGIHRFHNVRTDAVCFAAKVVSFMSVLSSRLTLLDTNDVAVANFRPKTLADKPTYYLHLGSDHDGDETFQITAQYDDDAETEVSVQFTDSETREPCTLSFEGHWRKRAAYFWLDRGNKGVRIPVAKIFCPDGVSRSKYHVAIESNMDAALIAIVCVILRKQQGEERDGAVEGALTAMIVS